jgi:hypothetical protein
MIIPPGHPSASRGLESPPPHVPHPADQTWLNKQFARPVPIFVGLAFPRDISTLWEAFEMLNEWPSYGRGPAHDAALDACRGFLSSEGDAEMTRAKVEAFARSH